MMRPYMRKPAHGRFLWAAGQRERPDDAAFWPGKFALWRGVRQRQGCYRPQKHATQEWFAGERFFSMAHWRMRRLRCGEERSFQW